MEYEIVTEQKKDYGNMAFEWIMIKTERGDIAKVGKSVSATGHVCSSWIHFWNKYKMEWNEFLGVETVIDIEKLIDIAVKMLSEWKKDQ